MQPTEGRALGGDLEVQWRAGFLSNACSSAFGVEPAAVPEQNRNNRDTWSGAQGLSSGGDQRMAQQRQPGRGLIRRLAINCTQHGRCRGVSGRIGAGATARRAGREPKLRADDLRAPVQTRRTSRRWGRSKSRRSRSDRWEMRANVSQEGQLGGRRREKKGPCAGQPS